jgi:anthranilate phosphoribosyltransferase
VRVTTLREAFDAILTGHSLSAEQAESAIGEILDGGAPEPLIAGFLVALRTKGETAEELAGGALAVRNRALPLDLGTDELLDTCGTGGDGARTFNISTGAALVAAAAGVRVAKHGNRAASGVIGAADAIEKLGMKADLDAAGLARCLERANFCFIFAPAFHPSFARLAPLRRALGIRTVFNLLGPLANPAHARRQLLGVADARLMMPMAKALAALGTEHAMVVHGEDGMDEISSSAETRVIEIRGGDLREYRITPQRLGVSDASAPQLRVDGAEQAMALLRGALAGEEGPAQDALVLNAGAAIYLGARAGTLQEGVKIARETIASGRVTRTLDLLRRASLEADARRQR